MIILSKKLQILVLICLLCRHISCLNDNEREIYIVYMGGLPEQETLSLTDVHHSLLSDVVGDETIARNNKIHSYGRSFNGFAAWLLPHEAEQLSQHEGVVSVFKNTVQKLHTTRSWDFLRFSNKVQRNPQTESNIIVALMDTGVWPDSPSFNDDGFGPPPRKWKGKCVKGVNFTGCNNKVIGAQYFNLGDMANPEELTPADLEGHGTHTASIAAGLPVGSASLYGIASGTARGAVPSARIASYKVCWKDACPDVDTMAAMDAAIADGVDIISVSIGGPPRRFTMDPIAIGAFHALEKGILTVCSAGNEGPTQGSVKNVMPWTVTVAASHTDRKLVADVELGNGDKISGTGVNTYAKKGFYSLTSGTLAKGDDGYVFANASACDYGSLDKEKIRGKMVYCRGKDRGDNTVNELGGSGTIMASDGDHIEVAYTTIGRGTFVSIHDGQRIDNYINSTKSSAKAAIHKTRSIKITTAPYVASFSSRGPQNVNPNILKPDISAPGVDILAAYSKFHGITKLAGEDRVSMYNIVSGTSMACPHVSGSAAYVKSIHPTWSPAAIKSALMTTAKPMKIEPDAGELASGSGQINPKTAVHPGLVYDIEMTSYLSLLCQQGYNDTDIALITGSKKYSCGNAPPLLGFDGLNYPSFHLQVENETSEITAVYYRTVTNVGYGKSTYQAKVKPPKGVSVEVIPNVMTFDRPSEKKDFKVVLKGKFVEKETWYVSGSLVWSDTRHNVRSPILVSLKLFDY